MAYLIDTNLLLRSVEPGHPMFPEAVRAVETLLAHDEVFIVAQNLIEFWAVATRPRERNGLGMTAAQAEAELRRIEDAIPLLPDRPEIYQEWRRLVTTHGVVGVGVHDARLAAAMLAHGVSHLLTFNGDDFRRYPGITVIHPQSVI